MNEKCFALRKDCSCVALETKNCPGYQRCPFYKPAWRQQQIQKKAYARLRSLSMEEQASISEKYYHGDMPWKEALI